MDAAMDFGRYMRALALDSGKAEAPIEPCVEQGAKHWEKRKEHAQLEEGAVLKVVRREGSGEGSAEEGDLVKLHYAVRRDATERVLESSAGGEPAVFVLGKPGPSGRLPRGRCRDWCALAPHTLRRCHLGVALPGCNCD